MQMHASADHLRQVLSSNLPCCAERNEGGVGDLKYPLVSDIKREISQKYQVLNSDGVALRGLFVIDKEVSRGSLKPNTLWYLVIDLPARGK